MRASAAAPVVLSGLAAFEELVRGKLAGELCRRDIESFLSAPDPLSPDDMARFMRFVGLGDAAPGDVADYKALVATLMAAARSARA